MPIWQRYNSGFVFYSISICKGIVVHELHIKEWRKRLIDYCVFTVHWMWTRYLFLNSYTHYLLFFFLFFWISFLLIWLYLLPTVTTTIEIVRSRPFLFFYNLSKTFCMISFNFGNDITKIEVPHLYLFCLFTVFLFFPFVL